MKHKNTVAPILSEAIELNNKAHNELILRPIGLLSIALLSQIMFLPHMTILITSFLPKTDHGYTFLFGIINIICNFALTIVLPFLFFYKKPFALKSVLELF